MNYKKQCLRARTLGAGLNMKIKIVHFKIIHVFQNRAFLPIRQPMKVVCKFKMQEYHYNLFISYSL